MAWHWDEGVAARARAASGGLLATLALTSGCAGLQPRVQPPLPPPWSTVLASRAVPLAHTGVALVQTADGALTYAGAYELDSPARPPLVLPLIAGDSRTPVVLVEVNGHSFHAMVDTGSSRSMIHPRAALVAGVDAVAAEASAEDGATALYAVSVRSFGGVVVNQFLSVARRVGLGDLDMRRVPLWIPAGDERRWSMTPGAGPPIEVVLGADFLRVFQRVSFDLAGGRMELALDGSYAPSPRHLTSVPMVRGLPLPLFPAWVRGSRRVMLIPDTGGSFAIMVPQLEAGRLGVPPFEDTRGTEGEPWTRYGATLGGVTRLRTIDPLPLDIGTIRLMNVPTQVVTSRIEQWDPPFGFLGNEVLASYVVTLDFAESALHFDAR